MKRFFFVLLVSLISGVMNLDAVNYCAPSSWGYAGTNVTGGGNAQPTLVSNYNELKKALTTETLQPQVIIVTQDIEFHKSITSTLSNLTLLALPGVKLINNATDSKNSGLLRFEGGRNIILRNIVFQESGVHNDEGGDDLTVAGVYHMWVDHCDFIDGMDGNFDICQGADSITVTWCRFRYSDFADADRRSNLIGSNNDDIPLDGIYNITYGFCWWDEGCKSRMPRCRNSELHLLNNYWNSSVSSYYIGPEGCACYFEGCIFEGLANEKNKIWTPFFDAPNACTFVNCAGNIPADEGTVAPPAYDYDHLTPAETKACVTDTSCGAGATLLVNTHGRVYSSCTLPRVDAVFYWLMSESVAPANGTLLPADGGSVYVGSSRSDKSFSLENASYNSSVPDYMKAKDQKGLKNNANAEYLTLKLSDGAFLAGDTLLICGYLPWKVSSSLNANDLIDSIQTGTSSADYNVGQLILPHDADSLVLSRNRGLGTGVTAIIVCRKPYEKPEEIPDTVQHSIMWNFSNEDFKILDTIKTDIAVRQLHLIASVSSVMVVDENKKSIDGYNFTHRLKSRGAGSMEGRHLWFDVRGDCTVDIYVASSNNKDEQIVNIATGSFEHVVATLPAVAGNPAKQTYNYTGGVNRIYLYGAEGAINIYGIKLTYPGDSAALEDIFGSSNAPVHKYLRNGQIFILRGNKTYTVQGQQTK